jgi:hypothetical protein
MKISKTARRTIYRLKTGEVIVTVSPKWPGWQVNVAIPPLSMRSFANRPAAEDHATYFAVRACAQADGYTVRRVESGRFAVAGPDGAPVEPTYETEGEAWAAAYRDSETPR